MKAVASKGGKWMLTGIRRREQVRKVSLGTYHLEITGKVLKVGRVGFKHAKLWISGTGMTETLTSRGKYKRFRRI